MAAATTEPYVIGVRSAEAMEPTESSQQLDPQQPAAAAVVVAAAEAPTTATTTGAAQASTPAAEPPVQPVVVIIGFGLPGRFVAEVLDARKVPYAVVELNPTNARSIASCGKRVISGDARDPNLRMLARCNYTSTGIKAERAGAFAVVVEEQIVALEFAKLMGNSL